MGSGNQPDVEAGGVPPEAGAAPGAAPPAASADFGADFPPPRKSVAYQPVPFRRKPAAVTCFS